MTRKTRTRFRRRRGFTLMEVLLVLVILVILGSLAVGAFTSVQGKANINAAKAQIGLFETPLDMYHLDLKTYPTTAQGLEALRTAPADLANVNAWGPDPYLDDPIPLDPWGQPYQYAFPGQRNTTKYDIWSMGPDSVDGTADDIGNWTEVVQ
jgi:general secretion pathway protein G